MRSSVLHLLAIATGAAAQYPSRPRVPGVAFRLTPDYGIAAIHLHDGTSVPVTQVYGSPGYKDFMRKNTTSSSAETSGICRILSPALASLPSAITLNIAVCRDSDIIHTKALLATLKAGTESYLGTNICYAALSLDNVSERKKDVVHDALAALGLHQVLPTVSAPKSFVYALRPDTAPAFNETPWPLLAIDYSVHWFSVGLYTVEEGGIVDPVEGFVSGPRIEEDDQLDALRETLSHLFAEPPAGMRLPEELRELIIYGDQAGDPEMRRILAEALLNTQPSNQEKRDLLRDARVSSSVFDGPSYTAGSAHVWMDTVDFETTAPSAFGCKWRSKLYSGYRIEL